MVFISNHKLQQTTQEVRDFLKRNYLPLAVGVTAGVTALSSMIYFESQMLERKFDLFNVFDLEQIGQNVLVETSRIFKTGVSAGAGLLFAGATKFGERVYRNYRKNKYRFDLGRRHEEEREDFVWID